MPTFTELETLAKQQTEESRRALLNQLTDMFLEGGDSISTSAAATYSDIISHVIDSVVEETRIEFSQRIASADLIPGDVVSKLAWDTFAVAAPIIEQSPVLPEDELVRLASERADPFLLAISRRSTVSEDVSDILLDRGSSNVVNEVAGNAGARFSADGLDILATKAANDESLQGLLVDRDDLPAEFVARIEPFLNAELIERLSDKVILDEGEVTGLVEKAKNKMGKMLASRRRDGIDAKKLIASVRENKISPNVAIAQLANETRAKPLATLLSSLAEVPESMISNVLLKVNGMPLAIACRALDVSEESFAAVAAMRCKVLRIPESSGDRLVIQYRDLDKADAERTMEFLKSRNATQAESAA